MIQFDLYFADFFNMENVKRALLHLTPEDVTDEQFKEEWDERFNAIREAATKNMLAEVEKRKKRLEALRGDEQLGGE